MRRRKEMHDIQELVRLHRLHTPTQEAPRALGMSWNTLLKYKQRLGKAGLLEGVPDELPGLDVLAVGIPQQRPPQQVSTAAGHEARIREFLKEGSEAAAIHQRLEAENRELDVSYDAVKRLCRRLRKSEPPSPADVAIRVETPPGEVAQIDFGYVGLVHDPETGVERKAWAFVIVLGFRRHTKPAWTSISRFEPGLTATSGPSMGSVGLPAPWCRITLRQRWSAPPSATTRTRGYSATIESCCATAAVGSTLRRRGRPRRRARSRAPCTTSTVLNTRRPEDDVNVVNVNLERWVVDHAGQRTHGTTRKQPLRVFFDDERPALLPLPAERYEVITWRKVKVNQDAHVMFERRQYSVPWTHIGAEASGAGDAQRGGRAGQ